MSKLSNNNVAPSWFQLERYKNSGKLDAFNWYVNLHQRAVCNRLLRNDNERYRNYFSRIKEIGILSEDDVFLPPRPNPDRQDKLYTASISPITFFDIVDTYETIPEKYKYDSDELDPKEFADYCETLIDIYENELDVWGSEVRLKISLLATDEQILSDIKVYIQTMRKTLKENSLQSNISNAAFKRWSQMMVLPYIDLEMWARSEQKNIPDHIYGNLLFPNDLDVDVSERIRKTVKPLAKKLLGNRFQWALQHQVGYPIL